MIRKLNLLATILFLASALMAREAQAFYSVMDTGSLLKEGHYKLGVETQFVTSGDQGVNLNARMDGPITDELNWKAELGVGTTDFLAGGYVKWVPFPDVEKQPAVGLIAGALYAHYEHINEISLRVAPFISKKFGFEFGDLTPYFALPMGLRSADSSTQVPVQASFGAEFRPSAFEKINFLAEMGFDVVKAFPYFSVAATLEFDEENGIQFK